MSDDTAQPAAAVGAAEEDPDAHRGRVVLYYTGGEDGKPYLQGVPARDLREADIARLVYVRSIDPATGNGLQPDDAKYAKARNALIDDLAGGPMYRKTAPGKER